MIIKKGTEYLDFNGTIQIDQQVASVESLDTVGTFSYSFTIPPTQKNKRLLGLESFNKINRDTYLNVDDVELQTDSGLTLLRGSIIVSNAVNIDCSFVSGNLTFFGSITGNVNEVDLSEYNVAVNRDAIKTSWNRTYGVVFPMVDRGQLTNRKEAFMRIYAFKESFLHNDFQPFIYVKDVVRKALQKAGLKIAGDLVNDPTYNSLITTNNSGVYNQNKFKEVNVLVGKDSPQTINSTTFTLITFQDDFSGQFYNSTKKAWDTSSSRWTIPFQSRLKLEYTFSTSNASKLINFQLRRNGIDVLDFFLRGTQIKFATDDDKNILMTAVAGDYFELWAKVDPSTPGTMDLNTKTFQGTVEDTTYLFAQSLVPSSDTRTFIKDIFRLFNVVCSFDEYSKTINTRFFKNIITAPEQDLSEYIQEDPEHRIVQSENGFELVSGYFQNNLITYKASDVQEVVNYNNANKIPYAGVSKVINNKFLQKKGGIFDVNFTAPWSQNYSIYGLQLLKLNFVEYNYIADTLQEIITSVTDDSGIAKFHFSGSGQLEVKGNTYKGDSTGTIDDDVVITDKKDSDAQIIAINIPDVSLPISFRFTQGVVGDDNTSQLKRLHDFTVPSYNGDYENIGTSGDTITRAAVATFAPFKDSTPVKNIKQGLSFGAITGRSALTLGDVYYNSFFSVLNDPVKFMPNMVLPENVYINFDFLRPVRLKTKDFNLLFFCQKIQGYDSGKTPCVMELVKL